jgi:hypothetical protein
MAMTLKNRVILALADFHKTATFDFTLREPKHRETEGGPVVAPVQRVTKAYLAEAWRLIDAERVKV